MDLFEQQWQTYRSVIENDWMEHRGVTAACSSARLRPRMVLPTSPRP